MASEVPVGSTEKRKLNCRNEIAERWKHAVPERRCSMRAMKGIHQSGE
jgi:hypothetical protein